MTERALAPWILRALFFTALILVWSLLARAGYWDKTLFPSPEQVLQSLTKGLFDGSLLLACSASLRRLLVGYAISLVAGVLLGILLARVSWIEQTLGSVVMGLQTLPSICWLPFALLWFGLNDTAILFVVVMGSLLAITVAVQDGVANLPPTYERAARSMGVGGAAMVWNVLLPASVPPILLGAKLGWSFAWRSLMAGELLFVSVGLGHQMMMGRELGDTSQVIAVMLVIIVLGLLSDRSVFGVLERRMRIRWGLGSTTS